MIYSLVFLLSGGDHRTPLVLSQTFEQARHQVIQNEPNKPKEVEVWILLPFRSLMAKEEHLYHRELRLKFPQIKLRFIYGINRLKNFPYREQFTIYRKRLGYFPVIFHCRGESTHALIRKFINPIKDFTVLDVRGYWPAEYFYQQGIEDITELNLGQKKSYNQLHHKLVKEVEYANGIVTVSEPLLHLAVKDTYESKPTNIVPCAVGGLSLSYRKNELADRLNLPREKKIIVYSGGYARYQHLEDLTLPFVKLILADAKNAHLLILSHQQDKILPWVEKLNLPSEQVSFLYESQDKVTEILSGCDLGLLIRRPSLVNKVAQPVKVGEYLAAGVPICFHKGVSGISDSLMKTGAGIEVNLYERNTSVWQEEAIRVRNFLFHSIDYRQNAINLAKELFLWPNLVKSQRAFYQQVLANKEAVNS